MVVQDNIAAAVLAWYETQWNKPTLTGKKQQVNADLSLNTGDYPWARESGDDIMKSYFRQFNVKQDTFDFLIIGLPNRVSSLISYYRNPNAFFRANRSR